MKYTDLQTKLIARLLLALLGFGLLFGVSLNYYLRALMETEVADKARIIFANVLAVQTYVRDTLRPVMLENLARESFVIEAMSTSYVTRKVMSDLNMARDQFSYRRVARDPRNSQYAANEMETDFISYFQRNLSEQMVSRFRMVGDEECYVTARPVVFRRSCLVCHGEPEDAPAVMLARYGTEKGFGRKEGEIGGLDILIVPVERERTAINRVTISFVLAFGFGTLCILGFNHFFFDRIMVDNIGRLNNVLRSRFPTEADGSRLPERPRKGDEIEGMVADMERFADHLRGMKEQLSDYAANLENKVEGRTTELRRESEARLADVQLFLDVLERFSQSLDRGRLLDEILASVAGRFRSDGAVFYCFLTMNHHAWPTQNSPDRLEPNQRDTLLEGRGLFFSHEAVVPVRAMDSIRGALALRWNAPLEMAPHEREVLLAVGHQLGIALENLEAMENILRQKAVLESVFEGIADPLFLLDAAGGIVHANESAHQLMAELIREDATGGSRLGLANLSTEAETAGCAVQHEVLLGARSFILRGYPMRIYGGVGRTIVYARDNTVEKTMLAKLQQGEKSLAVGKLAAGLAHEINNPLGVILCYARLLWDDGNSEHAEDLNIIIRHSLQAQKVLQDLMRFASPKPVLTGPVRLAESVEFIARVFEVRAARHNITIEASVGPDLPPLLGNAEALEQILTNIVINSMDALEESNSHRPGRILISGVFNAETGEVVLTIADNGPGIPVDDLPRLFDPFFTTKEVGKGTGLGLAVVYGLVRDLGGRVEVENRNGAVFTMCFIAAKEEDHGTAFYS